MRGHRNWECRNIAMSPRTQPGELSDLRSPVLVRSRQHVCMCRQHTNTWLRWVWVGLPASSRRPNWPLQSKMGPYSSHFHHSVTATSSQLHRNLLVTHALLVSQFTISLNQSAHLSRSTSFEKNFIATGCGCSSLQRSKCGNSLRSSIVADTHHGCRHAESLPTQAGTSVQTLAQGAGQRKTGTNYTERRG